MDGLKEQQEVTSTMSTNSSGSSTAKPPQSPLLSTLDRLSHSTSRPNLPLREGYASRTMRHVSQSLGVWRDDGDDDKPSSSGPARRASASVDTSSILYPTLENHPEPFEYPLLVLNLAALAAVPAEVSNDELLDLLLRRLEPWVGEEGEGGYCLVVLAAEEPNGKGKARALPGVTWWLMHWRRIPRKYRKNLKRLYIVHPSVMTRTVLPIVIPLLSPKSYSKLHIVPSLMALSGLDISLRGIDLSRTTLEEEERILHENPHAAPTQAVPESTLSWAYSGLTSVWGTAASYLRAPPVIEEKIETWSQDVDEIAKEGVPHVMLDLSTAILAHCATTEGIFRRSAKATQLRALQRLLSLPESKQPRLNWTEIATADPLLPPALFKRLLHDLPAPILQPSIYDTIRATHTLEDIPALLATLSPPRAAVLQHVIHTAHHILEHPETRMDARNLAIVLGPALINGPDPRDDLSLLVEPGKAKGVAPDMEGKQTLVGLLEMWIKGWVDGECKFEAHTPTRNVRHGLLNLQSVGAQAPPVASS